MNVEKKMDTNTAPGEHGKTENEHGPSPSRLSAAVEAAYILEAVRR